MILVKDYIEAWSAAHRLIHAKVAPPWPMIGTEEDKALNGVFFDALRAINATEDEARAASRAITTEEKSRFRSEHPRLLRTAIDSARRAKLAADSEGVAPGSRDDAISRSKDCLSCEGSGVAKRRRKDGLLFTLKLQSGRLMEVATADFWCRCPHGRFLLASRKQAADGWSLPDLESPLGRLTEHALGAGWDDRDAWPDPNTDEARKEALDYIRRVMAPAAKPA